MRHEKYSISLTLRAVKNNEKMGVAEEGTSMIDERINKAVLPSKKVIGFFVLDNKEEIGKR